VGRHWWLLLSGGVGPHTHARSTVARRASAAGPHPPGHTEYPRITHASHAPARARWEAGSYGYHGDDGRKYHNSGKGEDYGPRFGAGDTVGAGLHLGRQEIFFT
jgi:hypothetical protein